MTEPSTAASGERTHHQQISDAIASLYKQHIGRGPKRVMTVIARDTVLCVVEDTGIPYERTLLELGATDLVNAGRTRLQHHIAEHLISTVEAVTGHHVRGHVPGYGPLIDAATEVFLLDGPAVPNDATEIIEIHADDTPSNPGVGA